MKRYAKKVDRTGFKGTQEQEAIWDSMAKRESHLMVYARAGTGKTTSGVAGLKRLVLKGGRTGFVSFARAIADELRAKCPPEVDAGTLHSMGSRAIRMSTKARMDRDKDWQLLDVLAERKGKRWKRGNRWAVKALVEKAKAEGVLAPCLDPKGKESRWGTYKDLMLRYDLVGRMDEGEWMELADEMLDLSVERRDVYNFDDMIYWPLVFDDVRLPEYDNLLVDEVQDLNPAQRKLVMKFGQRVIGVGDDLQAMYAFRGADPDSMQSLEAELNGWNGMGVEVLPLTMCWRCPLKVVEMVKGLVPDIRGSDLEGWSEGEVLRMGTDDLLAWAGPGTLLQCRENAPLISAAYSLWKAGRKAFIRGRDIGAGLLRILESFEVRNLPMLLECVHRWRDEEEAKILTYRNPETKLMALNDKYGCLTELINGVRDYDGLMMLVRRLFKKGDESETTDAIQLSSIHRAKGLEAYRVGVLAPNLIPHYMASSDVDRQQELNAAYVAATRTKWRAEVEGSGVLAFAGRVPSVYQNVEVTEVTTEESEVNDE